MKQLISYFYHIDDLRRNRGIRVEDFVQDICSDRQYRRYLNGSNVIPQDKLILFIGKLGLTTSEFYNSFYKIEESISKKIRDIYVSVVKGELELAQKLYDEIKKPIKISQENYTFFKLSEVILDLKHDKLTSLQAYDILEELIDYPKCLSKNEFTFVEVASLQKMFQIKATYRDYSLIEILYDILIKADYLYLSSDKRYLFPRLYTTTGKYLGILGNIEESVKVALEGIDYSIKIRDMDSLEKLYYIVSLGYQKLGRVDEAYLFAQKCIATCVAKGDEKLVEKYNNFFRKEQGFELSIEKKFN